MDLVARAAETIVREYRRCVRTKYRAFGGDLHRLPALAPSAFRELYRRGLSVELDFGTEDGVQYNSMEVTLGGAAASIVQREIEGEQTLVVEYTQDGQLEDVSLERVPIPA